MSGPPAELHQYTYGPYGDVLAVDAHPTLPLPVNRIGHQGLFFERLTTGSVDAPMLAVGARGLYNSRNRWLHVELGRFLTRDPAAAALPIITALAFNGELAAETATLPFSPTGHYADGFNLYEFTGSNPVNRSDPLGLEWGIDEDIDEVIGNMCGGRAADAAVVTSYIGMSFNVARLVGQLAFSMLPGSDGVMLAIILAQGGDVHWMDFVWAGLDLAGPIGKIAGTFAGTVGAYAVGVRTFANVAANSHGIVGLGAAIVRLTFGDILAIARGHAWFKHADDWAKMGVHSAGDFASVLQGIVSGPGKPLKNDRQAWFDRATGIVVISDPGHPDKGTAFIPKAGFNYFVTWK